MKTLIQKSIALVLIALASLSSVKAEARDLTIDWNSLYDTCHVDWTQYSRRMIEIQDLLMEEFQPMTKPQFTERFLQDDPKIYLAQATWPELLRGKDDFWKSHKECSTLHREFRALMDSTLSTPQSKREALEAFSDCIHDKFTRGQNIQPFDRMLICYQSQVK
jgi:hypothetical protein